ncbi:putative C-type lectin-like 10 [Homarus americanus]|uniref:Putative C-type lectin-like 10 n=1 Tax=Homarus americanus TaxID=6706 RepID=A0A8J5N1Q2_HOMAM|nr:putative C-type lectin-like 10 [Homarus americanus]
MATTLLLLLLFALTMGQQCIHPYAAIGGRCIYIDPFILGSMQEVRNVCQSHHGDILWFEEGTDCDFYRDLLNHLHTNLVAVVGVLVVAVVGVLVVAVVGVLVVAVVGVLVVAVVGVLVVAVVGVLVVAVVCVLVVDVVGVLVVAVVGVIVWLLYMKTGKAARLGVPYWLEKYPHKDTTSNCAILYKNGGYYWIDAKCDTRKAAAICRYA